MSYRTRDVDPLIERRLCVMGGVILEGARGRGKTSIGRHLASSVTYLDDPETATRSPYALPSGVHVIPLARLCP